MKYSLLGNRKNPPYDHVGIITNHPTGDAFGRLRVAESRVLHDGKNIFGDDPKFWASTDNVVYGTNRTVFQDSKVYLDIEAPTGLGDYVGRITRQSYPYQAGLSRRSFITGIFNPNSKSVASDGRACLTWGIGDSMKYDDAFGKLPDNGIVLSTILDSGVNEFRIIIRRKGETLYNYERSEWDDKLDGNGHSKITLDLTKGQIIDFDYEWLGTGRKRFSLNIDGVSVPIFEINNANKADDDQLPYMLMPNLRVFYGAYAKGGTTESSRAQIIQICSSLISESPTDFLGTNRIIRKDDVSGSIGTTFTSILAARIHRNKIGTIAGFLSAKVKTLTANSEYEFIVCINPTYTPGAETWNTKLYSNLEYSEDIEVVPTDFGIDIGADFGSTTQQSRAAANVSYRSPVKLGHDGYDNPDEIHLLVRTLASTATFRAHLNIEEGY